MNDKSFKFTHFQTADGDGWMYNTRKNSSQANIMTGNNKKKKNNNSGRGLYIYE